MENSMINYFDELNKTITRSVTQLAEINTRILNDTIERQVSFSQVLIDGSQRQVELLSFTNDPKEFAERQTELADFYSNFFVETTKENMTIAQKTSEEYKTWIETNVNAAESKAVKTTPKKKAA